MRTWLMLVVGEVPSMLGSDGGDASDNVFAGPAAAIITTITMYRSTRSYLRLFSS